MAHTTFGYSYRIAGHLFANPGYGYTPVTVSTLYFRSRQCTLVFSVQDLP
jgi:hypothetical protein